MVIFRSFNDIVLSYIEFLRLVQPNLDTKPGTVARDLFIDAPSEQLADFYNELRAISNLQSFLSANGDDLARLASNFGVERNTGSTATGVAVFTTNNLDVDILIPSNTIVTARNGISFKTLNTVLMRSSSANVFRANATRLRSSLDLAGITDEFAVEISVEALTPGIGGNIGIFSLISQNVPGISNITNIDPFAGGTNSESDSEFRTRILSIFAGSNTGTALGYESTVRTDPNVLDVLTVEPGDPLLIRDGTQTVINAEGELVVTEPGSGGKVDIYVLGSRLQSGIDTFIFNDQSGTGDATHPNNDIILGQQGADPSLNVAQRRIELIGAGTLPLQPIAGVVSVVGSASGSNFVEQFVDEQGRVRGNYTLSKDEGDFGGSPFGFDKLSWVSNEIELTDESVTKGVFNGSDSLLFSDVTGISNITQDIFVTNENSITNNTDRSSVQLRHAPVRTVSRIVNLTTGERYVVTNQNPDGDAGDLNTTGRITISGSTLPVGTDVLQVDYTWVKPFDRFFDFDNLEDRNIFRSAQDSVDWSFANLVRYEPAVIDAYGQVPLTHAISRVISVDTFVTENTTVNSGSVILSNTVSNVIDMRRVSDGVEVWNTDLFDGSLSGTTAVILPTDTLAEDGDIINVRYNAVDVFEGSDGYDDGTFEGKLVTLPENIDGYNTDVLATYISNVNTLLPATELGALPATKDGYQFVVSSTLLGEQPTSHIRDGNGNIIKNLRRAASNIRITAAAIGSAGALGIVGTSVGKVVDALVVISSGNGYDIDLADAIKDDLGVTTLGSNIRVSQIESVERVNLDTSSVVESVDNVYDIINYRIANNTFDIERGIEDSSLNSTSVSLPRTSGNTEALLDTGDIVRVTFYYLVEEDTEQLFFSRNGQQTTDKVFFEVDRIQVSSGFLDSTGTLRGEIVVTNHNQPIANSTYEVDYDYTAPKENERITITFNSNDVPRNTTLSIEDVRPITADVLIKEADARVIDMSIRVVLLSEFIGQEQTVLQNAIDSVTTFLNANSLGGTIDASDVINNLYSVSGIDRARILNFSTGDSGNVLSVTAERNEYLQAGLIDIQIEER